MRLPLEKQMEMRRSVHWKDSEPFIENKRGELIHRPRAICTHKPAWGGPAYLVIKNLCGSSFTGYEHLSVLSKPPKGNYVCARCEQEAKKRGLPTSDELIGHHVHLGGVVAVRKCHIGEEV